MRHLGLLLCLTRCVACGRTCSTVGTSVVAVYTFLFWLQSLWLGCTLVGYNLWYCLEVVCVLVLCCRAVLFVFVLVFGLAFLFVVKLVSPVVSGWSLLLLSLLAVGVWGFVWS